MGKVKSAKGKSKKVTWKKIKHQDVDDFLVEKAREERLGIKDKADDQLFFVDQLGFDDDYSELSKKKKEAVEKRTRRTKDGPLVDMEELTCFKILKADSAVKDPFVKRNAVKKGGGKKTAEMQVKDDLRYFLRNSNPKNRKSNAMATDSSIRDLWGEGEETGTKSQKRVHDIVENEWLSDEAKRNILRNRSTWRPSLEKNKIQAVEVPHPGLSYNPSFQHHQEVLAQVVEVEKAKLKKQQKITRATAVTKVEGDGTIPEIKDEPEESDEEDDKKKVKITGVPKPKTKQQKRKEVEQRDQEAERVGQKLKMKKESQVYRLKTLKKEIVAKEVKQKARLNRRVEKKEEQNQFGAKTLSRFKFEEKSEQPLLSDELGKGLINAGTGISSAGDLLLDRFKSLQKRNVIETRIKQTQKRKHKPKKFIRDSDKMEWEKTGMWNGEKLLQPNRDRRRKRP